MSAHQNYMKQALELAEKGCGHVSPNPMVGAIIVKDGRIIGSGYHQEYGKAHAERNALASCQEDPKGATMYVTLEPCCHYGKQPPCTDAIIEAGIRQVIVGSSDPNPQVAGKGIQILRDHGIQVTTGVLKEDCDRLNQVFLHFIQTGRPYVVMKYAMTMDGKIAAKTGLSQWITEEPARQQVQQDRNRYTAIMAGIGTVLKDDPQLTCRIPGGKSPVRIICDTNLRIPMDSRIVTSAQQYRTILATACNDPEKQQPLLDAGCQICLVGKSVPPSDDAPAPPSIDLKELMKKIGAMGIDSILLEGGGQLNWSALNSGIVNKVQAYIAPKLLGGMHSPSPVSGPGVDSPDQAFLLTPPRIDLFGKDIRLESEVIPCSPES